MSLDNQLNKFSPAYIDSLCDIVPNRNRKPIDFKNLLELLQESPKECIPFKGKILQHLEIHALDESKTPKLRLLALCYAKAAILSRKGPNKDEGPVGEWKSAFTNSLIELDKNTDELYEVAGIQPRTILSRKKNETNSASEKRLKEAIIDYQVTLRGYLLKVNWAAHCLCALISMKTEFDLPIPVDILIKASQKLTDLKCRDYEKLKQNTIVRSYIYTLTDEMFDISFMLIKALVTVLTTDIIPFIQPINQNISKLFGWTRTSGLMRHQSDSYHSLRAKLFNIQSFMVEQLSLNINLEPETLVNLIEVEVLDSLENNLEAMICLESLLMVYKDYLDANLEGKIKNYIIQACLKIYRDFKPNNLSVQCRRQLLQLLNVIANQPYATSTTEISYHIFELVEKLESDRDMKAIARRSLKLGLSHRPTIVSSYDVYNSYNLPMLINSEPESELAPVKTADSVDAMEAVETAKAVATVAEKEAVQEKAPNKPAKQVELVELDGSDDERNSTKSDDSLKVNELLSFLHA